MCTGRNALENTGDYGGSNFNFRSRASLPRLQAGDRRQKVQVTLEKWTVKERRGIEEYLGSGVGAGSRGG